jgi:hypothetical protein
MDRRYYTTSVEYPDPGYGAFYPWIRDLESRILWTKEEKSNIAFHFFHVGSGIRDEKMFGSGSRMRYVWNPG